MPGWYANHLKFEAALPPVAAREQVNDANGVPESVRRAPFPAPAAATVGGARSRRAIGGLCSFALEPQSRCLLWTPAKLSRQDVHDVPPIEFASTGRTRRTLEFMSTDTAATEAQAVAEPNLTWGHNLGRKDSTGCSSTATCAAG